jgi:hypothetical protein
MRPETVRKCIVRGASAVGSHLPSNGSEEVTVNTSVRNSEL